MLEMNVIRPKLKWDREKGIKRFDEALAGLHGLVHRFLNLELPVLRLTPVNTPVKMVMVRERGRVTGTPVGCACGYRAIRPACGK